MTCNSCKFFLQLGPVYGRCKRYPPQAPEKEFGVPKFLILPNSEWCGEYRAKPNKSSPSPV